MNILQNKKESNSIVKELVWRPNPISNVLSFSNYSI